MSLKCHMYVTYAKYFICRYEAIYVHICTSYELVAMNNVTKNTDIHTFTFLAYCPEQICLPHHIHMFHSINKIKTELKHYLNTSPQLTVLAHTDSANQLQAKAVAGNFN